MDLPGTAFEVHVAQDVLDDLQIRLSQCRMPNEDAAADWRHGPPRDYMRRLVACWRIDFDWRAWEKLINRFQQRLVRIDDFSIHVIVETGSGTAPLPLVLTHGWPGSFLEFIDIIEPLAHPERFGGDAEDGFTVIVPSLPGYGFSSAPSAPITPDAIAALWHRLAVDSFGFERYVAQGGDWGSAVTSRLALNHPERLVAVHLNMCGLTPQLGPGTPPMAPEEQDWAGRQAAMLRQEDGYQRIQATKPQTLAYAMTDSPAGLAAWIVEKFQGWTIGGENCDPPFTMDRLLANIMLYWISGSNAPSWLYVVLASDQPLQVPSGCKVSVPAGFSLFTRDLLLPPPRSWLERCYDVAFYKVSDQAGHFPAMEQGSLLVEDVRSFFRAYR